ncbi:MAG: sporulation membrane protein YtaF [Tumebacillaceae bacterium]
MTTSVISTIIMIGLASNLDNGGIGIAYGVRKISIPFRANLMIGLISFMATLLSGYFGQYISQYLHPTIANWIGTVILIAAGVWVMIQPFRKQEEMVPDKNPVTRILKKPESADWNESKNIEFWESVVLGITLAMNALAGGLDAGLTGINIFGTAVSVGVFSLLSLGGCAYLGEKYAADKLGDRATIVAGLLLILVGFHQVALW